ncbi:hypothetical protein CKG00_02380 [Morganella morganii]|uniref:Filamentous haemagglutinin FhaB/tRNA nuclease CdiA-like TPS domain-containing protein n=1 Tax=Morganella morganii TaxID=582 RepID=A0A433ZTD6_MORMO|nr:filamentous hemagglutinin N-terminal domain-containing protein [Morganella morganii]RUT65371.1 hypothetical protein CKG00_02380 [Morganella morganii]
MKFTLLSAVILTALSATSFAATEQTFSDGLKIKLNEKSTGSDLRIYKDKPVLAIANPDKNKISHNYFDEFNVGKEGLYIGNNKKADTIVAEVVSNSLSQLKGGIEILGNPGNLVIANPNGITCSGCSFSNAPEVTFANAGIDDVFSSGNMALLKNSKGGISIADTNIGTDTQRNDLKKLSLISDDISISRSKIHVPEINIELMRNEGDNVGWSSLLGSFYKDDTGHTNDTRETNRIKSSLAINKNTILNAKKININLNESLFTNKGTLEGDHLTVTNTVWKDNFHSQSLITPEMTMINKGEIKSKLFTIKTTPKTSFAVDIDAYKSTFINNGFIASHVNADLNNSIFINNNVITKNNDIGGSIKLNLNNAEFINNHFIRTSGITIEHRGDAKFINNNSIYLSNLTDYSGKHPVSGEFDSENFTLANKGNIYKYNSYKKTYKKAELSN